MKLGHREDCPVIHQARDKWDLTYKTKKINEIKYSIGQVALTSLYADSDTPQVSSGSKYHPIRELFFAQIN